MPGEWTSSPGVGSEYSLGAAPPSVGTGMDAEQSGLGAVLHEFEIAAGVRPKPAGSPRLCHRRPQQSPEVAA